MAFNNRELEQQSPPVVLMTFQCAQPITADSHWITWIGPENIYRIEAKEIVAPWTILLLRQKRLPKHHAAEYKELARITVTNQLTAVIIANQLMNALKRLPYNVDEERAIAAVRPVVAKYAKTSLATGISSAARINEPVGRGTQGEGN